MAAFEYTKSQGGIKAPTANYNVQPNLTVQRGFEQLTKAVSAGMQLGTQINEANYKQALIEQRNTMNQFKTDFDGAAYEQQKEMMASLPDLVVNKYQGDDVRNADLRSRGLQFQEGLESYLAKTGIQIEHTNNVTSQNVAFIDYSEKFNATNDINERLRLRDEFHATQVKPYEGLDDPLAQELYSKGMKGWQTINTAYQQNLRTRADNEITTNVMTGIATELKINGFVDEAAHKRAIDNLSRRSDYYEKEFALKTELNNSVLRGLYGVFNNPDMEVTRDNYKTYMQRVEDYTKLAPNAIGSEAYKKAITFGLTLKNRIEAQELTDIQAMLLDPAVPQKEFEVETLRIQELGTISPEQMSSFNSRKAIVRNQTAQREIIAPLIQSKDYDGLVNGVKAGEYSGSMVRSSVKDTLEFAFAQIQESTNKPTMAALSVLQDYKAFKEKGIAPTKIDAIDNILKMPSSGTVMTNEDIVNFLHIKEAAREANYVSANSQKVNTDYLILKGYASMGIPDMAQKFNTYKNSPISVKEADVESALLEGIDAQPTWSEDLNPENVTSLRGMLRPAIKSLMKAGVDPSDVRNELGKFIEQSFINADPKFGWKNEVLIPITNGVRTEDDYNRAYRAIDSAMQNDPDIPIANRGQLQYLGPKHMSDPESDWIAIDSRGVILGIPYEKIESAAKTEIFE
jgi:hypothetical protein